MKRHINSLFCMFLETQKPQENLEAFVFKWEVNLSYSLISLMVDVPFSDVTVMMNTPEAVEIAPTSN